jgi:DNA-binding LacI/PurR family transcriptional regulator
VASILDISRITGVSKSTVQRVLSGKGSFSKDVAEKVWNAARELNYRPNGLARAMKTKQTNMIGVIVYQKHMPIISHPFYGPILDSVAGELKKHGYGILLVPDSEVTNRSGDWLIEHRVDGMVLLSQITKNLINYFKNLSIPFVLVNNSEMMDGVNYIVNDDYQGAYDAAHHLIQQGYRRIAFVSGPTLHRSYRLRLQGFLDALSDHGMEASSDYIHSGDSLLQTGSEAAKRFIAMEARPDAIFTSNDMMAIGVLKELFARGIVVPRDIALVGFDDIDYARLTTPALTTVRVDKGTMGRIAVEKLISMLKHNQMTAEGIVLTPKLIVRESSVQK